MALTAFILAASATMRRAAHGNMMNCGFRILVLTVAAQLRRFTAMV